MLVILSQKVDSESSYSDELFNSYIIQPSTEICFIREMSLFTIRVTDKIKVNGTILGRDSRQKF